MSRNLQEKGKSICLNNILINDNKEESRSESDESEIDEDSMIESYKVMFGKWLETSAENRSLVKDNKILCNNINELEDKLKCCESELSLKESKIISLTKEIDNIKKNVKMLNPGSTIFEKIQKSGQTNHAGLGYVPNQPVSNTTNSFVSGRTVSTSQVSVSTAKHSVVTEKKQHGKFDNFKGKGRRFIPICHFCGVKGHIRPKCITMHNMFKSNYIGNKHVLQKQKWVVKNKCLVGSTCFKTVASNMWYFDSGCSRHMTGEKEFLVNIRPMHCGEVTFGNGLTGKVIGMGTLKFEGLPKLKNVMLVEGLKANLLSISQICDQGYTVSFDSNHCYVYNILDEIVLQGLRSSDNCYTLTTHATCHSVIENVTDLWHEKLGHIHFKNLKKLSVSGIVRGLPKLGKESLGKCGPCQLGKQLKISHKSVPDVNTSRVLELLHMDLMGPIQEESLNGKRYIFVCVDVFSRFSWVDVLKLSKLCV